MEGDIYEEAFHELIIAHFFFKFKIYLIYSKYK